MSYTDRTTDPGTELGRRATAVAGVVAIHAALAGIVVAGLSVVTIIREEQGPVTTFDVPSPKPPPPSDPVTDPAQRLPQVPNPPIPLPPQPGPQVEFTDVIDDFPPFTPPEPVPGPTLQPDPPRPAPSFTPRLARPANGPAGWVTADDYPSQELREGIEGQLRYRLSVASNGRVSACEIVATSGAKRLDEAACRMISRRARFDAASDETGARVVGTYTGTVRWEIPD